MKYTIESYKKRDDKEALSDIEKSQNEIMVLAVRLDIKKAELTKLIIEDPANKEIYEKELEEVASNKKLLMMNHSIVQSRKDSYDSDEIIHKVGRIDYCCYSLQETINEDAIYISRDGQNVYFYTDNGTRTIHFCPFCGSEFHKEYK